jgi:hypothetical protein
MRTLAPKPFAPVHETQPGINSFKSELDLTPTRDKAAPPSIASQTPVTLLFQNHMQTEIRLVWLDENGKKHERGSVKGASRFLIQTFANHTWLILDDTGTPLGHIIAPEKPARIIMQ